MKYNINVNQKAVAEHFAAFDLDLIDMAIFDYCHAIISSSSPRLKRMTVEGRTYTWINAQALIEQMPLIRISSKDVIYRRLKKLVAAKLLEKHVETHSMAYFAIGEKADLLKFDVGTTEKSEGADSKTGGTTDKSEGYDSKTTGGTTGKSEAGTTQKSDNNSINHPEIHSGFKQGGVYSPPKPDSLEVTFFLAWEKTYCKPVIERHKEFIRRILEQYSPSVEIIEEAIRKNKREDWAAEDIARICNKNTGTTQSETTEEEMRAYVEERRNTRRQA